MNYTQSTNVNALEELYCANSAHFALSCTNDSAEGSLTNYKEVVDIDENYSFYDHNKKLHYGLSSMDVSVVKEKAKKSKKFFKF